MPARRRQKQLRSGSGAADENLPLLARKPTGLLGVSSEEFHDALSAYVRDNPDGLLRPQVWVPSATFFANGATCCCSPCCPEPKNGLRRLQTLTPHFSSKPCTSGLSPSPDRHLLLVVAFPGWPSVINHVSAVVCRTRRATRSRAGWTRSADGASSSSWSSNTCGMLIYRPFRATTKHAVLQVTPSGTLIQASKIMLILEKPTLCLTSPTPCLANPSPKQSLSPCQCP